jgi:hypothetical protein
MSNAIGRRILVAEKERHRELTAVHFCRPFQSDNEDVLRLAVLAAIPLAAEIRMMCEIPDRLTQLVRSES